MNKDLTTSCDRKRFEEEARAAGDCIATNVRGRLIPRDRDPMRRP